MRNRRFRSRRLHPLFVFNRFGDPERCALRPGNVHGADGREHGPKPVPARYSAEARPSIVRRRFRADAAFAIPALFDLPQGDGRDHAIRIRASPGLRERIGRLTGRRSGQPPNRIVRQYASFHYRAQDYPTLRNIG